MRKVITPSKQNILKSIGPGLLFASSAIGTSHLIISTRAGAHHGMIFFWIILGTLFLKYPFFEFGTRYAVATGNSLITGYKKQGTWAILLFLAVVFINMFAVTGAIGAVTAGILKTIFAIPLSMPLLVGLILAPTVAILFFGGFSTLDGFIKILSVVLLITVSLAFFTVIINGPLEPVENFKTPKFVEGAGLALLVSLIGWMPAGMEASTMNSIWVVEKVRSSGYKASLKESLFDFNLGYVFTIILAIMFLTIGAFTMYGSGQLFPQQTVPFTKQLLIVFTQNVGPWSYWIIAIAAFGTIYGTLITILDAFTRSFIRGLLALKTQSQSDEQKQKTLDRFYRLCLPIIGLGGFALFYFSATSMVKILEFATILGFLTAPIIAFLNLRAMQSPNVSSAFRPSVRLIILAYVGLLAMLLFALYYVFTLVS